MPSSREILRRFRPVAAPGALSRRGVPADRIQERDAELQPVFALLADVEREAAAVRAAAAEDAAARESAAREAAAALRAEGRTRAAAERNAAAADRARLTEDEGAATVSAARARAAELAARCAERLPPLVASATARVLAHLDGPAAGESFDGSAARALSGAASRGERS
jgi:flagellar biosynthesis/type III secretory pathway protein FliH